MEDRDTAVRRFIFGAAVIILVAVFIWFIFLRDKQNTQSKDAPKSSPSSQGTTESSSASSQNSASTPISGQTTSTSTQQGAQLANVGPGNTMAMFLTASTIGAVAHYSYRRRMQFSKIFVTTKQQ